MSQKKLEIEQRVWDAERGVKRLEIITEMEIQKLNMEAELESARVEEENLVEFFERSGAMISVIKSRLASVIHERTPKVTRIFQLRDNLHNPC